MDQLMQFYEWPTIYTIAREMGVPINEVYGMLRLHAGMIDDPVTEAWARVEPLWIESKKPYYLVYPTIIPMLTRLRLDLDCRFIAMPLSCLLFRLPKGNPLAFNGNEPHSILAFIGQSREVDGEQNLGILIDFGERMTELQVPMFTGRTFALRHGLRVEESLRRIRNTGGMQIGLAIPEETILDCLRLVLACCLLADDSAIIEPDVLNDDRDKYERTGDRKYVDKAHRRGKIGWVVGRKIDVAPHYRRPHMMLAWTGPGRTIPKVVPRKGSIIHREIIERMPSGFGE
jgi:hypothetical protein